MISAAFPYEKQRKQILGRTMAYVEAGSGITSHFPPGHLLRVGRDQIIGKKGGFHVIAEDHLKPRLAVSTQV